MFKFFNFHIQTQASNQPPESKEFEENKHKDVDEIISKQNASIIEIEDVGEDLGADKFINLDEHGKPVKNDNAERLFSWIDDNAAILYKSPKVARPHVKRPKFQRPHVKKPHATDKPTMQSNRYSILWILDLVTLNLVTIFKTYDIKEHFLRKKNFVR